MRGRSRGQWWVSGVGPSTGPTVYVPDGATPRAWPDPSVLPSYNPEVGTLPWHVVVTPTADSQDWPAISYLLSFGALTNWIRLQDFGGGAQFVIVGTPAGVSVLGQLEFVAGVPFTLSVNPASNMLRVTGAATGNGEASIPAWGPGFDYAAELDVGSQIGGADPVPATLGAILPGYV